MWLLRVRNVCKKGCVLVAEYRMLFISAKTYVYVSQKLDIADSDSQWRSSLFLVRPSSLACCSPPACGSHSGDGSAHADFQYVVYFFL